MTAIQGDAGRVGIIEWGSEDEADFKAEEENIPTGRENEKITALEQRIRNLEAHHDNDRLLPYQRQSINIIALSIAIIIGIGLLIAGIVAGALGALSLYAFIPMIVAGALGVVATSIILRLETKFPRL